LECLANSRCDEPQRVVFTPGRARARMNDDPEQTERVRAIELVDERRNRLRAKRGIGCREIDQIARVRHRRTDASLIKPTAESPDLVSIERAASPLIRILREALQRLAAAHARDGE